jgi:hypothetical protein
MPGKRIVLLEMTTEDAEAFVRAVDGTSTVVVHDREDDKEFVLEASVQAVVAKPQRWCKCDVPEESRAQRRRRVARRESSWSRGKMFGWWICAHCAKPSKPMVTHFVTTMLAGANDLLPHILNESATPLTPSDRWRLATGTDNPHANAQPGQPFADTPPKPRRKKRRSERDREARAAGAV